jgi:chromate reductase
MVHIAVFIGSLRSESINRKYIEDIQQLLPAETQFNFVDLQLPLFNEDLEADFPASAQAMKDIVTKSDGVLFVTPEYNRSFSGVLKNAIDWASRPYGANAFDGKPAAIIGVSRSALGAAQAQEQLRNVLLHLNTKLIGQPEMYINRSTTYTDDGQLTPDSKQYAKVFIETFSAHIAHNS